MKIDSSAIPFVAIAAIPAVLVLPLGWTTFGVLLLLLPAAVALFFRDPVRQVPNGPDLVLAPADGRVMHAGPARPGEAPPGVWQQVTIFLSVLDVHINRTPVAGTVGRVEYVPGTFHAAFKHDASANEHTEIWIDHAGTTVVVRQVVGVLARRIVCRVRPGNVLPAGAKIGLMKFGSRMDVFLPDTARLAVTAGTQTRGGETIIARL